MGIERIEVEAPAAATDTTMRFPSWRETEPSATPDEIAREAVMARAKAEAMAGVVVPEGGHVEFISTLPYVGGERLVQAVVRQPIRHPDLPA